MLRRSLALANNRAFACQVHMRCQSGRHNESRTRQRRHRADSRPAYISTTPQDIDSGRGLDLDTVASKLSAQIDNWCSRGCVVILP